VPLFLFSYRLRPEYSPPSADGIAAWNAWLESMGDNVVDRGNPVVETRTLGYSAGDSRLGGYTLVSADDLDSAVAMAERCPGLRIGAGIEIGELTPRHSSHPSKAE
jgi:hypothetical protein